MKCRVCDKEAAENGYCEFHMEAHENVVQKYELWREACGVSWEEYLSDIVNNVFTGEWAKEVAEYLIRSGEK